MTLGEKIRQLRKRKKMTQSQLAQVFNISADYLLFDKEETSLSAKISDQELFEQFEAVDKMDEDKKDLVKRILSMAINEDKIKKLLP